MKATRLSELLKAGDRVAVSNITGREAAEVTAASQAWCGNIVGGWALGKGGTSVEVPGGEPIPVFATVGELFEKLPAERHPNKIIVYSPPAAVYGEVKEIIDHGMGKVETLFIITEHVSVEVTAKVAQLCRQANVDVIGCNTLGVINTHDGVRAGAVGGDDPEETFRAGSAAVISNSGNMVNTMASYLLSAGLGNSFGISTGKDVLILTPLRDLLELARNDERTKIIVLYVEPGGLYEAEAVKMMRETKYPKPVIAYVTGQVLGKRELSLGHAGAVVEGGLTSAEAKMKMFDEYFGAGPFDPGAHYERTPELVAALRRGIRIQTLHDLPGAAQLVTGMLGIERDMQPTTPLRLNPWFVNLKGLSKRLPARLILHPGTIPEPYASQVKELGRETLGAHFPRRSMRNASFASSNDGAVTRLYGVPMEAEMKRGSFVESMMLAWTGQRPQGFEKELVERCLIASITNGPGSISAQGAKLSASAGNAPNTGMIAALASMGEVHGGNGREAVEYLLRVFKDTGLVNPYDAGHGLDLKGIVHAEVERFSRVRAAAKEAGTEYERIPCMGHPVYKDKAVNVDPREQVIREYLAEKKLYNVFLEFYHMLAARLKEAGIAKNVWAVNVDGAIATVTLGMCWKGLAEKRMTVKRAGDLAFLIFALGRVAGAAGEFLDHQDYGEPMDMRIPTEECEGLTRPKD